MADKKLTMMDVIKEVHAAQNDPNRGGEFYPEGGQVAMARSAGLIYDMSEASFIITWLLHKLNEGRE